MFIFMSVILLPYLFHFHRSELYETLTQKKGIAILIGSLSFSSNSKDLNISKIYTGLPKKFIFPKFRIFYFKLAVLFFNIKDKLNI